VLDYNVELPTIPLFVKAGTIIPLEEDGELILHVYPGTDQSTSTHVYSDAGDGYGPWRLDTFKLKFSGREVNINWEKEGEYPFPYTGITLELHAKQLVHAVADGFSFSSRKQNRPVNSKT
jgi:alpha-glucosidase